jgi:tetratricopeptide (TPR) repeat protein
MSVDPSDADGSQKRQTGRKGRRWHIPPAILREPDETVEGWFVLTEIPGTMGLCLWIAVRDVTLWAGVAPESRAELFSPGAAERRLEHLGSEPMDAAVEVPLATLAALVAEPEKVSGEVVCLVCRGVAAWAEGRGAWGTALTYAQAAALAAPTDASAAYEVGRLALAWGRDARAETWLRRTVGVARRARAWEPYTRAYVDLGAVLERRGAHAEARRQLVRAYRAARRYGLLPLRAAALHGLMRVARAAGDEVQTERLARAALRASRRAPTPALLLDVAALHLARERTERATAALRRMLEMELPPRTRAAGLALLARSAAASADGGRLYEEAWNAAWTLATDGAVAEHTGTLLDLARAAAARGDWLNVEQALGQARGALTRPEDARAAAELAAACAAAGRRGGGSM